MEQKLRQILESPEINHKKEIIRQPNILSAHAYCKVHQLSGQLTGTLIEYFIKHIYAMTKNKASSCTGDLGLHGKNFEVKVSLGGKYHVKFNYVQLRPNHNCDYILTAYHLDSKNVDQLGELFIFKLNKCEMKRIILNHGQYAHGTIKVNGIITGSDLDCKDNSKEYAIRPKYGDTCWIDLLQFRCWRID